jgi:hypothetical protein
MKILILKICHLDKERSREINKIRATQRLTRMEISAHTSATMMNAEKFSLIKVVNLLLFKS